MGGYLALGVPRYVGYTEPERDPGSAFEGTDDALKDGVTPLVFRRAREW
jgi:hypothetical protein